MSLAPCTQCGYDPVKARLEQRGLSASLQDRRSEGDCQVCPPGHQPEKVWVIKVGPSSIRLCPRHMARLVGMTTKGG